MLFTSGVLRHMNVQTMTGDASDEKAEALNTPGVSDGSDGGMYLVEARVWMSPLTPGDTFLTGADARSGRRRTAAAVVRRGERTAAGPGAVLLSASGPRQHVRKGFGLTCPSGPNIFLRS